MQLSKFESELKIKLQNAEKKRLKREKAEEAKKKKLAEECILREQLREEEEKKKLEEECQRIALAQQQKLIEEQRRIELARQERVNLRNSLQKAYDEYNETLQSVQKKIKRLRKKLREIDELEEKLSISKNPPSKEQLLKIGKKQEAYDDIVEAEEEEELLIQRKENGEFNEILNWPDEIIPDTFPTLDNRTVSLGVESHEIEQNKAPPVISEETRSKKEEEVLLERKENGKHLDQKKMSTGRASSPAPNSLSSNPSRSHSFSWVTVPKGKKKQLKS